MLQMRGISKFACSFLRQGLRAQATCGASSHRPIRTSISEASAIQSLSQHSKGDGALPSLPLTVLSEDERAMRDTGLNLDCLLSRRDTIEDCLFKDGLFLFQYADFAKSV